MKNPKVGERVAFTWCGSGYSGTITRAGRFTSKVITARGEKFTFHNSDLRRLVPKKRERTYTEDKILLAVAGVLGASTRNVWPKILRALREGSGK